MRTRTVRFNLDGLEFVVIVDNGTRPSLTDPGEPGSLEVEEATFQGKPIRAEHLERYLEGKHKERFDEKVIDHLNDWE